RSAESVPVVTRERGRPMRPPNTPAYKIISTARANAEAQIRQGFLHPSVARYFKMHRAVRCKLHRNRQAAVEIVGYHWNLAAVLDQSAGALRFGEHQGQAGGSN